MWTLINIEVRMDFTAVTMKIIVMPMQLGI
jgi:hypothetical protein